VYRTSLLKASPYLFFLGSVLKKEAGSQLLQEEISQDAIAPEKFA